MSKHLLRYIVSIGIILLAVAFILRIGHEKPSPDTVPQIDTATNTAGTAAIPDTRGRYTLVNFWNSHNAVSRIAAGEYDRFMRTHPGLPLRLVQINTDSNRTLFDEIVGRDSLRAAWQYHISDTRAGRRVPDYNPAEGYSSYLVSPRGDIICRNPEVPQIEGLLKRHAGQ